MFGLKSDFFLSKKHPKRYRANQGASYRVRAYRRGMTKFRSYRSSFD